MKKPLTWHTKSGSRIGAVDQMELFIITLAGAYLAGSVNFSILVFKILGKPDPRTRFSKNPGVTNVYRQAGWPLAALVLILDMGRAAAVALLAQHFLTQSLVLWVAAALILGNRYPCFHGFSGGKGVANYLGFHTALMPLAGGLAVLAYGAVFAICRIPFIASFAMLAVLAASAIARWGQLPAAVAAVIVTLGLIVWFHRGNIAELAGGK
jgi:acyl phosphate:glycerol-3-phosphate acyltransferase